MLRAWSLLILALALPPCAEAQSGDGAPRTVRRAAERALAAQYPQSAPRLDVRVRRTGGTIGDGPLAVDLPQQRGIPEGLTRVRIRTQAEAGQGRTTGRALLYVAHFDSVMTTRHDIRAGETITAADVETAWVETTDFRGRPLRASDFRALTSGGTLVATRLLAAGQTLRESDVRPPYAASTGAPLTVQYRRGRLVFRLSCQAREPGFANDVIRVYCPSTRTTYRARLTGRTTAAWVETL